MNMRLAAAALAFAVGAGPIALDQDYGYWTTVNGHRIYYELRGAGTPLLLLHGGGSGVEDSFGNQLEPFALRHRIIAPEQVGQGHTPDVAGPLSYTRMTEDTAALLQQLHLSNVDVIGFSDGGILALILALRHPELVRRLVISGANLDPSGLTDTDAPDPQAPDSDVVPDDGAAQDQQIDDKLAQLWLHYPDSSELSPELLRGLHKRVLVMAGDQDQIKLDHTLLIYQSLPYAQLWILPGTGHATFSERWRWVNPAVLYFLDRP